MATASEHTAMSGDSSTNCGERVATDTRNEVNSHTAGRGSKNEQILADLIKQRLLESRKQQQGQQNNSYDERQGRSFSMTSDSASTRSREALDPETAFESESTGSDGDSDFEFEQFVGLEQWEQIMNENEVDFDILGTQLKKHEILGKLIGIYKTDEEFYSSQNSAVGAGASFADSSRASNNNNSNNGGPGSTQPKKKKKKKKKKDKDKNLSDNTAGEQESSGSSKNSTHGNSTNQPDESEGDELMRIFKIACVLCDKFTKPCNNDTFNISLDFTSNLLILFSFDFDSIINEFELGMKFVKIIDRLMSFLNFDNLKLQNSKEIQLRSEEFYDQAKTLFVNTCRKYQGGNSLIKSSGKLTVNELIENVYSHVSSNEGKKNNTTANNSKNKKKKLLDAESILKDYTDDLLDNMMIYDNSFYKDWIPLNLSYMNLELIYSLLVTFIYSIYKLYSKYPKLYYNPFLKKFFELWRTFTNIMMVGIQIDRLDEGIYGPGTPWLVKSILKGCSAVRTVLATILNQETTKRRHDLTHESLNNYMLPFGRKNGDGAFTYDVQIYAAALIVLGNNLTTIGNLFINMEVGDKLDDDIWYIFEYEFTTASGKKINEGDEEDDDEDYDDDRKIDEYGVVKTVKKDIYVDKEYTARCYCEFDDANDSSDEEEQTNQSIIDDSIAEVVDDQEEENEKEMISNVDGVDAEMTSKIKFLQTFSKPKQKDTNTGENSRNVKFGAKDKLEFDKEGNDWRDIPRGDNKYFNTKDEELESFVVETPADFSKYYDKASELIKKNSKHKNDAVANDVEAELARMQSYYLELDKLDECRIVKFEKLYENFQKMADEKISSFESERVLECIISVINHEYGCEIENEENSRQDGTNSDTAVNNYIRWYDISSDRIYGALSSDCLFEKMLKYNQKMCFTMLDEMLMIRGYRRVLIWMIANLSMMNEERSGKRGEAVYLHGLIDYIHELLIGKRKVASRMGSCLVLSDIEKKMLFNEFINNLEQLEKTTDVGVDNDADGQHELFLSDKTLEMICLMIRSLLNKNVVLNDEDSKLQMQSFLIKYISRVTNIRILYFDIYKDNEEDQSNSFLSDHVDIVMDTILRITSNNELEKVNKYGNGTFSKYFGTES